MPSKLVTLSQWIAYLFDHRVTEPSWYWAIDAEDIDPGSERTVELIAETFERAGELLGRFSDAQLNQGFWFLVDSSCSGYMLALSDTTIPWPLRRRALRSFVPLFEQIMAPRCTPHLSDLDERGAGPLNGACYMWWDILPLGGCPDEPDCAELDAEVLSVLQLLLAIPHDACRESALHGLGHWRTHYPKASLIIDDFLRCTPGLRQELVDYAEQAKIGCVL